MSDSIITLDVREDLRNGREPFAKIMQTVAGLKDDEKMRLIAPFRPTPLFAVMAQQGFRHEAKPTPEGDWEVLFARSPEPVCSDQGCSQPPAPADRPAKILKVDARGLEPPQPLIVILEAVANLVECQEIQASTDRKPVHLYDELLRRGFSGQTEEQPDGSFLTLIRRK